MSGQAKRRLAAIVAADVAGYSRLVGLDEERTLASLRACRAELIEPLLAQHVGRIANTAGDSYLLEFPSAVEALRFAIAAQAGMAERNRGVEQTHRIEFRVGINVGDVVSEGVDLLGNGVNVAARLEGLAAPGGIVLSRAARDQVRDQVEIKLEDLGEVQVKNIARPVRAFRVLPDHEIPTERAAAPPRHWLRYGAVAVLLLAVVTGIGALWWLELHRDPGGGDQTTLVSTKSDKPSIAVLPFDNISGDAEQDYLADGMTDDLITDLSKVSGLVVIARNSVFALKAENLGAQELARRLDVTHVLQGSVRRVGSRIRINAQLTDAKAGNLVWAERFDRQFDDIFAVQSEVATTIVSAMEVALTPDEKRRVNFRGTENLAAYDAFLRGESIRRFTKKRAYEAAVAEYERALQLDPNFALAKAALADTLFMRATTAGANTETQRSDLAEAQRLMESSIAGGEIPLAYVVRSKFLLKQKVDHARAEAAARKAVALDPNSSEALAALAEVLMYASRPAETLDLVRLAKRLDPIASYQYHLLEAQSLFMQKRYAESLERFIPLCEGRKNFYLQVACDIYVPALYAHLGETDTARELLRKWVCWGGGSCESVDGIETSVTLKYPFRNRADHEHLMDGIRKGWPAT